MNSLKELKEYCENKKKELETNIYHYDDYIYTAEDAYLDIICEIEKILNKN